MTPLVSLGGKRLIALGVALLVVVATLIAYGGDAAQADHEPANKYAAAGSSLNKFDQSTILLQERVRVSSPFDLVLQMTAECSIITELTTGGTGETDFSEASGQVEIWIEIDGRPVPISTVDRDPATPGTQADDGRVVFCNRTYGRSVQDTEGDGDVDREDDYIRTRSANAFNWLALDTGFNYDDPANGNNILDIVVKAEYTTSEQGRAVADAFVGFRTLIVEPTNASVHEAVLPADPGGT